ncbi:hypothetical protein [Reyranella sp.]|jgi:hypothetical protein|uniref:hypothetical protein n=1 Tax=Reyranella sp. TaxID=1929291 RepID=UPI003BAC4CE6
MLAFLANNIEQLDLALEHVALGDANNARFGLMLTDNIVEITLHQLALDRKSDLKHRSYHYEKNPYQHSKELEAALGRFFDQKLKFAVLETKLSEEEAESIKLLHNVRNEVYHVGVRDNVLLPDLARLYFYLTTAFLARYEARGFGWGSSQQIPERAKKYFSGDRFMPGKREDYAQACAQLHKAIAFDAGRLIRSLADHMHDVIEQEDTAIDVLSQVPQKTTRDQAVLDTQAWSMTFTDEGKEYIRALLAAGRPKPAGVAGHVALLASEYPFTVKRDPIPSWRKRAATLRKESNPHRAFKSYRAFTSQTEDIRALLDAAHSQADAYIEEQIDRAREERALRER